MRGIVSTKGNRVDTKYLYRMLSNRAYLGEAVHKGDSGEHDAIVDHETWGRVHAILQPCSASPRSWPSLEGGADAERGHPRPTYGLPCSCSIHYGTSLFPAEQAHRGPPGRAR